MKIGFTYDLRDDYLAEGLSEEATAELDSLETIDILDETISGLGHDVERIGNIKSLVKRLASGERWDLVFNIAEGLYGLGREAQVPALLDAYCIPYTFSETIVQAVALQKALTKRIVLDLGIPTAEFHPVRTTDDIANVQLSYPLFAKPVAEGTGRGISGRSIINNFSELDEVCRNLLEKYKQPVLVERYLPGREITVGVLGTGSKAKAVGAMEIIVKSSAPEDVYGFVAKEMCEHYVEYKQVFGDIAEKAKNMALVVHRGINCRDSSRIDFKESESGELMFLELNPLAGLHPTHSDLPMLCTNAGMSFQELIKAIIDSALERVNGFY